jgi:hypothetical protein
VPAKAGEGGVVPSLIEALAADRAEVPAQVERLHEQTTGPSEKLSGLQ